MEPELFVPIFKPRVLLTDLPKKSVDADSAWLVPVPMPVLEIVKRLTVKSTC